MVLGKEGVLCVTFDPLNVKENGNPSTRLPFSMMGPTPVRRYHHLIDQESQRGTTTGVLSTSTPRPINPLTYVTRLPK